MVNYWYQCEDLITLIMCLIISSWSLVYKRGFMYVNIFWMIMPGYTIIYYLLFNNNRTNTFKYTKLQN